MTKPSLKTSYHHGNLHQTLLENATEIIRKEGIEGLSLRKLAESSGVSRTAPYHHFKNKNELLCAIAEEGFKQYQQQDNVTFTDESLSLHDRFRKYLVTYVQFANKNPELYELMFGRTLWKKSTVTKELRAASSSLFKKSMENYVLLQAAGVIDPNANILRLHQVIWGTIHGIAKLQIDGIYTHAGTVEEICQCAAETFIVSSPQ